MPASRGKRGIRRSVQALERDIRAWVADWNDHPRPFTWTWTADEILDKVATCSTNLRLRSLGRPGTVRAGSLVTRGGEA